MTRSTPSISVSGNIRPQSTTDVLAAFDREEVAADLTEPPEGHEAKAVDPGWSGRRGWEGGGGECQNIAELGRGPAGSAGREPGPRGLGVAAAGSLAAGLRLGPGSRALLSMSSSRVRISERPMIEGGRGVVEGDVEAGVAPDHPAPVETR